jgi:polyisoprenoid-binding protein YceI
MTYFFVLRSDTPAPVSISNTISQQTETTNNMPSNQKENKMGMEKTSITASPKQEQSNGDNLIGIWVIDASSSSYVGYRVKEELVKVGTFTAVGRTNLVNAELEYDGKSIVRVSVKADLRGLQSDNQYRDRALSNQAIETSKFPYTEFELAEEISIADNPEKNTIVEVNAKGTLNLHGVTNKVEIPLSGKLENDRLYIIGTLPIIFDQYDIAKPSSRSVLSIEDNGIMEISLVFIKQ